MRTSTRKKMSKELKAAKNLNGWISPEGKGTWSRWGFHWRIAAKILKLPERYTEDPEYTLQKLGYVKVQTLEGEDNRTWFTPFNRGEIDYNHVTQKQINFIFDICEAYNVPCPTFLKDY